VATDDIQRAIDAIRTGLPVLLPTDTVYGLCTAATSQDAALRLYQLKGRQTSQPTALLAAEVETLCGLVPEWDERTRTILTTLLPGPYTLVLPNPGRRFRWLSGIRPDSIGVRVPDLPDDARRVVATVTAVMATSGNDPGGPNPVSLDDVPKRIREACAAELDAGPLAGTPSTVIDFTSPRPYVIRDGIAPADAAIERVSAALA
jgi:L-threonylcarbamoyladenylate synthase